MLPDLSLLVALFLGLSSASTGPVDGVRAVAGTVAATLAGVALSWLSAERVIRLVKNPEDGRRRRVVRLSGVWPLVAWIAAVEGFDWVTWVVDTFPRTTWLLPYVVLFLPVAVLWSAEWAAQGRIASALSPGGAARGAPGPWASVRRGLARNGLFLAPLPIVVGVLQGIWLLGHWGVPGMREASQWFEAMPILGLATAIVVLALVSFALPGALRRLLSTTSMPAGPTRALLERQATAIGLRYRDIVVWRTHGRMLNAMVVGFTPGTRTIFVTDGLLNHLPEEEVLAVFSHEAGHAMKRHLPLFLLLFASTALAFGVLDAVFEAWGLPEELGLGVYLLFIWFVLLGVVARFFEREADVYGADHAADLEPSPESLWVPGLAAPIPAGATRMIRALERVRLVAGEGRSHTHGTISQRVAYVAAWATDPEVRERFQRRRRGLHRLFAAGVLLAVLVTAVRVPTELAVARGVVAFDRGIEAATALEARLPVRRPEDAARWREALDDFDEAARSLAGRGGRRAERYRLLSLANRADARMHGLGDLAGARHDLDEALDAVERSDLEPDEMALLVFPLRVDLGRALAEAGDVERARALLEKARAVRYDAGAGGDAYRDARLALLEASIDAAAGRLEEARHRVETKVLASRSGDATEWEELREDARRLLERIPPGGR